MGIKLFRISTVNTHTRSFQYSMVAGDKIYYNSAYSGGPEGTVKSVGGLKVYYNSAYSGGPAGSIKSTSGSVN